ncbi:WW domain-binding protein 1-like isoform X2 [Pseudophryne corroboree]|uniref:WW domain-binding protein 1-like isoform X2 n=1 Tax=Pseudophryne corroboree TaxID=495146 RepID=UPI003081AA7B
MRREELAVRGSVYGREFCFGEDRKPYRCEIGYCCGDAECCTYYYELWWFWLAWTLIILAGCCCACRHRRVKLRHQHELRQREISLMAYQGFTPPAATLEPWPNCKLPTYDEVTQDPPTPPPPYSEILDEVPTGEGNPTEASITNLDQAWSHHGEPSPEAQGSTVDHSQPHHDHMEQESLSALERRRHVTGDSGIVLCDEKVACMSEREETALCRGYISVDTGASTA